MVIQGIIAHSVHCLLDGSEFEEPVFLHVLLTLANHRLGIDPHACCEPGLDGVPRLNLSSAKVCWNCLTTCSLVNLALSVCSGFGHVLPVFSSVSTAFHSCDVNGEALYACLPIAGARRFAMT